MKTNLDGYRRIFSEVSKGVVEPVYLLHGSEGFIMEQLAEKIAFSIIDSEMRSFNLDIEYGGETDVGRFLEKASEFPFMAGKRVLILKELEMLRGGVKDLSVYCEDPSPSSIVILIFNSHDENGRKRKVPKGFAQLEKTVGKTGRVIEFSKLNRRDLVTWITAKAKSDGVALTPEAAEAIVRSVGENIYDIKNELDKIIVLFEGREAGIDDIAGVIGSYRYNAIYDLVDSLGSGNGRLSLGILMRILNSGAEKPSVIIYHLIRNFLTMLKIKLGNKSGGYWYRKRKRQADNFTREEILLWLENLRIADIRIKSGYLPDELVILGCFLGSMENKVFAESDYFYYRQVG